jgi:epoxyqueuosine reductase
LTAATIRELARDCGFELAGVAAAEPGPEGAPERAWYHQWVALGFAGEMRYLTDHRAAARDDPRHLLASARSVVCVGKLYNTRWPYSTQFEAGGRAWISRYAWGEDYHGVMRRGLERLDALLRERAGAEFQSMICVDTAPVLERSYARMAGLGWIGKNTCLINQAGGSWFFLGELLVSLAIERDAPPPGRCGTCTRCIDACPTAAIVPAGPGFAVDSRRCISYLTIELRSEIPVEHRAGVGGHVFGCDICQDVCPWNRRAAAAGGPAFEPRAFAPPLEKLAAATENEFYAMFGGTPVTRAKYAGFLRNVAVAMGNRKLEQFRAPLENLAASGDPLVAEHARWGLEQ